MLASSRKPTHQCTRAFGDGFHNGAVATCSQITDGTKINNPVHNTAKNMLAKKKHLWMKMSERGGQKQTRMLANSCNLQTTALGERERSSRNVTVPREPRVLSFKPFGQEVKLFCKRLIFQAFTGSQCSCPWGHTTLEWYIY